METDRHYFFEGLFIIAFSLAAAIFAVWLGSPGRGDDVTYRIHFPESVSGLTAGDSVKFQGVDVGTVKSMAIDPDDSRRVRVDVRLRKETPVRTDTRASLTMKGITGVVFIELNGGDPAAKSLLEVTRGDAVPEIPSEKTGLKAALDNLPKVLEKFSALEDQLGKVVKGVGGLTKQVSDDPSSLVWGKGKDKDKDKGKSKEGKTPG
jgi:phospholipid/cholesterol/gamma-HCH transport system substrate-binding protein